MIEMNSSKDSCMAFMQRMKLMRKKIRVTVEPVVLLYMLSTFMLLPVLQDLIYTKVNL